MKFYFLALAMLAITSTSGVYASARSSDETSTSTQSFESQSLRGMFLNEDKESTRGLKRRKRDDDDAAVCGPETGTECVATLNARSSYTLMDCFYDNLPFMDTNVTIVEYFNGTVKTWKYSSSRSHKLTSKTLPTLTSMLEWGIHVSLLVSFMPKAKMKLSKQ